MTDEIENERGITPVSSQTRGSSTLPLVAIFLAAVGLCMWSFWPDASEVKEEGHGIMSQDAEIYDRERYAKIDIPDFPKDKDEPRLMASLQAVTGITEGPTAAEREAALQERIWQRRKQGALVVDERSSAGASTPTAQPVGHRQQPNSAELISQAMANLPGNGQPAQAMDTLDSRISESTVPTVTARVLQDRSFIAGQGKMISAVLETAISTDLPGMVRAIVSEELWSEDGTKLLINPGDRLVGEYRSGIVRGQARFFVVWQRVLTAKGIDVQIDSPGTDSLGRAGHAGWIDSHFFQRFGASFMLSMIGAYIPEDDQASTAASESFKDSAAIALENSVNIAPTGHKNQGDHIKVFIARDINFKSVIGLL